HKAFPFENFAKGLTSYSNYYSEQAQAVDFAKEKLNLKKGLATYWNAKPADLFNKSETRVYTCLPSGYADYYIVGNEQWFYSSGNDTSNLFNFILLGINEDTATLYNYYGKPLEIVQFKSYNVLLYNDFIFKPSRAPFFVQQNKN
ncbi:MAG: hypothetical protein JXB34_03030, partial [Bacteroidales bacterium]|nr:hypothetical protein [Bacteroidales bacterium]